MFALQILLKLHICSIWGYRDVTGWCGGSWLEPWYLPEPEAAVFGCCQVCIPAPVAAPSWLDHHKQRGRLAPASFRCVQREVSQAPTHVTVRPGGKQCRLVIQVHVKGLLILMSQWTFEEFSFTRNPNSFSVSPAVLLGHLYPSFNERTQSVFHLFAGSAASRWNAETV